jgi:hypothetical protein
MKKFQTYCKTHDRFLKGQPFVFSEGNLHQIDLSDMMCEDDKIDGYDTSCNQTWVIEQVN